MFERKRGFKYLRVKLIATEEALDQQQHSTTQREAKTLYTIR